MKILLTAGLLCVATPTVAFGQGATLGSAMPAAPPRHLVRYRYTYLQQPIDTSGPNAAASTKPFEYSGSVDVAVNDDSLYYREYRNGSELLELLLNRKERRVLLFNRQQNRLNLFRDLPYRAAQFIPFPFQDEEMSRLVRLAAAKNATLFPGTTTVSATGTLGEAGHTVPAPFRATLTNTPAGPRVDTFSIRGVSGDVADWAFTYGPAAGAGSLPREITRIVATPYMTDEEQQAYLRHDAVPPTHWKKDADIRFTLVADREGNVPSEAALLAGANAQTTVVDRRDLKNPISFSYRKGGGDLEGQIQEARHQAAATRSLNSSDGLRGWIKYYALLAPLALGVGYWAVRRRIARPAKV